MDAPPAGDEHMKGLTHTSERTQALLYARPLGYLVIILLLASMMGCNGGGSGDDSAQTVSGLVSRPFNGFNCVAPDYTPSTPDIQLATPYPSLPTLNQPVAMYMAPGDSSTWYVVQQPGQVVRFDNDPAVNTLSTFIDISGRVTYGGEQGLLGMAFHPDYANNGFVYLSYTGQGANGLESRISRFQLSGQVLDPNSEQIVLRLDQPYSNHNGGQIAFGPDGYLYIGFGDGGSGGDPQGNGQNTSTLLGAMLRIDVGNGVSGTYSIPLGNPFASGGGAPEIYAWGLRNPWRWSFDSQTGELWVGDVGQNEYEEIDKLEIGKNYGWNIMEGLHCYSPSSGCNQSGLTLPVAEYDHTQGVAVTGGYVYRGTEVPALQGLYTYGDYGSGKIWALVQGNNQYSAMELIDTAYYIPSFAQAHNGELYVLHMGGTIYKIQAVGGGGQTATIPNLLSGWGCFAPGVPEAFSSSVIRYDVNTLLWSDNAGKDRFMAIPDTATINIDSEGRFVYPVGSVLGKHFRLNGQVVETRLIMRHQDPMGWTGYSYEWNAAGTDAVLLTDAKDKTINGQVWHYPSRTQCMECHTQVAGITLGPELGQLNRNFTYSSTGITANQLDTYESIGILGSALSSEQKASRLYAIDDSSKSAELRARSYLHTNCAMCHQPGGTGGGNMDLRMATSFADMGLCGVSPLQGDLGIAGALLLDPGNSDNSILYQRMTSTDASRMPPLSTSVIDAQAAGVVRDWIDGLAACS